MKKLGNTRTAFGEAIRELVLEGKDIVAVNADTEKSMCLDLLKEKFPQRVINVGIAEQNMMMVAAGIASTGKIVFACSYAMLNSMRALEQVRTFIAYPYLNVKIVSGLSGLTGGIEGVTHQSIEDIAIMRSIPNMVVLAPADYYSTKIIVKKASEYKGPVYIRLGRKDSPDIFDENYQFKIGRANKLREGKDACLIATGLILDRAIKAVDILEERGYSIELLEMPSIKPIDKESIIAAARRTGRIITIEDHSIIGGLGGAVAELLAENYPVKMKRIGVNDTFAESAKYPDLLDKYGLSINNIVRQTEEMIIKSK
ncbi:MAG TPA: transketolase family protein [Atribacterota bacterium]|nr:transketolase family protein [Atribacterota bacterium]